MQAQVWKRNSNKSSLYIFKTEMKNSFINQLKHVVLIRLVSWLVFTFDKKFSLNNFLHTKQA